MNSQCVHTGKEPLSKSGEYMHVSGGVSVGPAVGRGLAVGRGVAVGVGVDTRHTFHPALVFRLSEDHEMIVDEFIATPSGPEVPE